MKIWLKIYFETVNDEITECWEYFSCEFQTKMNLTTHDDLDYIILHSYHAFLNRKHGNSHHFTFHRKNVLLTYENISSLCDGVVIQRSQRFQSRTSHIRIWYQNQKILVFLFLESWNWIVYMLLLVPWSNFDKTQDYAKYCVTHLESISTNLIIYENIIFLPHQKKSFEIIQIGKTNLCILRFYETGMS